MIQTEEQIQADIKALHVADVLAMEARLLVDNLDNPQRRDDLETRKYAAMRAGLKRDSQAMKVF